MAKAPADIRSLARGYTRTALQVLQGIMTDKNAPQSARVNAATYLLDRGWGKPQQSLEIEDKRTHEDAVNELIGEPLLQKSTETRGTA